MKSCAGSCWYALECSFGAGGLCGEHGPVGDIIVPLHEQGARTRAGECILKQRPDGIGYFATMTVYEEGATCIIFVFIMATEVNFTNFIKGKVVYIGLRRCAEVGCGDEDVVDI